MNSRDWDRIRSHWKDLLAVDANSVIACLFQAFVLTDTELETAKSYTVNADRMEYIMLQIKKKPKKVGAFEYFIKALREDKGNEQLVAGMENFTPRSDPAVSSQPDPHLLDEDVRSFLCDNFASMNGKYTKVSEVKDMLISANIFTEENTWDDETMTDFMKKMFTNVTIEVEHGATSSEGAETTEQSELAQEKEIKDMSEDELKNFLKKNGISDEVLEIFEKEDINGEIFFYMKEEDFKSILPATSFGVRKKLILLATKEKFTKVKFKKDFLRNFDSRVSHLTKYTLGNRVDISIHSGSKKTDPIRNFHLVTDTDKDKALAFIGSEYIAFISACLNERLNGTIYFGISPENGEIVGVTLLKDDLKTVFQRSVQTSFIDSLINLIHNTVREAEFVPIISNGLERIVVEIDVVPNTTFMQEENIVWTKTIALPVRFETAHKQNNSVVFGFSSKGTPYFLSLEEFNIFEKSIKNIVKQRKEEEMEIPFRTQENLRLKFLNLYTAGKEKLMEELYPFLLTSPLDESEELDESLHLISLIKDLQPEVVFDFENFISSSGLMNKMEENSSCITRTFEINDFGDHIKPQDYRQFITTLHDESRSSIPWMSSSGDKETSTDAYEWNKRMRPNFQKALNHFIKIVNKDRIIVFMLLLSKNYSTMMEACEEVLVQLPNQWILLAESEEVVKIWQEVMLNRGKVSRHDVQKNCIVGLSWEEVGELIGNVKSKKVKDCCKIPRSTNVNAEIPDSILLKWNDINVLSAGDASEKVRNEQKEDEIKIQEQFYSGDEVDWLNFSFRDQVMERSIHTDLLNDVRQALTLPAKVELEGVPVFTILHQPGAGGTTTAKHILWDLRKEFRCCVVLRVTKQTCDQIHAFRQIKDTNPKPVLVMVDNEDDFEQLRDSFIEKNKETHEYGVNRVYCIVIQCIRLASLPPQLELNERALRHALNDEELLWFNEKYTHLQKSYSRGNSRNINPDFLLAFNILRENFKEEKIDQMVKRFTESINSETEMKLLKVVSLINAYDPYFSPIPVSCLDVIFKENPVNKKRNKQGIRPLNWEASLSEAVRVLLNISRRKATVGEGPKFIKVFHKIVAHKMLTYMKERTGESDSQVMNQILDFEIFYSTSLDEHQKAVKLSKDARKFKAIIGNIFKKRMLEKDFKRRQKFSDFILHVEATESSQTAAELIELLYFYDEDAFTAQLIARFYMDKKEWTEAEKFAKLSIDGSKESSYVWDTLGQIYKAQIADTFLQEKKSAKLVGCQEGDIHEMICLAEKSFDAFREGQSFIDFFKINLSVFFGELRTIAVLLSALSFSDHFKDKNILHRFLIEPEYQLTNQKTLLEKETKLIKSLDVRCRYLIWYLEIQLCHLETTQTMKNYAFDQTGLNKDELIKIRVNLLDFFGERTNDIPQYYNEIDSCKYRLRLARRLGASSLISLLSLKKESKKVEENKLQDILKLMLPNVQSKFKDFEDLLVMLHTITVLILDGCLPKGISYNQILSWCKELYLKRSFRKKEKTSLEMYLYYVMYNFPTPERSGADTAMQADLIKAIEQWQEEFKQNLPKIERRKKETMVFFLGDGGPLHDLLFFESSEVLKMYTEHEQWQHPKYKKGLRVFNGILQEGGQSVKMFRSNDLIIPAAFPVLKQEMFQKKIFFYIGFSISGPKAFGMCREQPEFYEPKPDLHKEISAPVSSPKQEEMTLMDLIECLKSCMSKLEVKQLSPKAKKTLEKERLDLCLKIYNITGGMNPSRP